MSAPSHIHVPRRPRPVVPPTFEGRLLPHPTEPVFDQGLAFDIETLLSRRQVLRAMGFGAVGAGLFIAGCGPVATGTPGATSGSGSTAGSTASSTAGASLAAADCDTPIPEETAGPYPGDGTGGPDVLSQSGVVRADIRSSFGSSTTVASGVPITIRLAILDLARGCAPIDGAAVYLWHCDQQGRYSLYSQGAQNENYLRGVQAAGADGIVSFTSIFPACYPGRWPHIHFEVYPTLDAAKGAGNRIATSQIALPKDICDEVYATSGYEQSVQNLQGVSLSGDMVFGEDDGERQIGAIGGSISNGLTVDLSVPVSA